MMLLPFTTSFQSLIVRGYIGKDYEPKMRVARNKLGDIPTIMP